MCLEKSKSVVRRKGWVSLPGNTSVLSRVCVCVREAEPQLLFGRGYRAGIDVREQSKETEIFMLLP